MGNVVGSQLQLLSRFVYNQPPNIGFMVSACLGHGMVYSNQAHKSSYVVTREMPPNKEVMEKHSTPNLRLIHPTVTGPSYGVHRALIYLQQSVVVLITGSRNDPN